MSIAFFLPGARPMIFTVDFDNVVSRNLVVAWQKRVAGQRNAARPL